MAVGLCLFLTHLVSQFIQKPACVTLADYLNVVKFYLYTIKANSLTTFRKASVWPERNRINSVLLTSFFMA